MHSGQNMSAAQPQFSRAHKSELRFGRDLSRDEFAQRLVAQLIKTWFNPKDITKLRVHGYVAERGLLAISLLRNGSIWRDITVESWTSGQAVVCFDDGDIADEIQRDPIGAIESVILEAKCLDPGLDCATEFTIRKCGAIEISLSLPV